MNQTWHPEHFFCSHCGEVFGAEGATRGWGVGRPRSASLCLPWKSGSCRYHPGAHFSTRCPSSLPFPNTYTFFLIEIFNQRNMNAQFKNSNVNFKGDIEKYRSPASPFPTRSFSFFFCYLNRVLPEIDSPPPPPNFNHYVFTFYQGR